VVRGLQAAPNAATGRIAGFQLFPFGGLRKAADWLHSYPEEMLRQIEQAPSAVQPQKLGSD
jgi:methylenetetrahydrofolate reductase (NADPH)